MNEYMDEYMDKVKKSLNLYSQEENIRILSLGARKDGEDGKAGFETIDNVRDFLSVTLPENQEGRYWYTTNQIADDSAFVIFKYAGKLLGAGVLTGNIADEDTFNGVIYKGYYQFDPDSIITFTDEIPFDVFKNYVPKMKSFSGQAAHRIDKKHKNALLEMIKENTIGKEDIGLGTLVTVVQKEGKPKEYYAVRYERNPQLREEAIRIHGIKCEICGFSFEEFYGSKLGKDYIEIHHIKPLSSLAEEVDVNPETDLICVCANCHRMLHRKKNKIITPNKLKLEIKNNNS